MAEFLDNIQQHLEEGRIISYRWLAHKLEVRSDRAKRMLYDYSQRNEGSVECTFCVTGVDANGERHVVLCTQPQLDEVVESLTSVTSVHVYSVQKVVPADSQSLIAAECIDVHQDIAMRFRADDGWIYEDSLSNVHPPNPPCLNKSVAMLIDARKAVSSAKTMKKTTSDPLGHKRKAGQDIQKSQSQPASLSSSAEDIKNAKSSSTVQQKRTGSGSTSSKTTKRSRQGNSSLNSFFKRTPSGGTAKSEEGANQRVLKRHAEEQPPSPEMDVESDSSSEDDEAEVEARIARLETEREMAMEEEGDEEAAESEQCPARTKTGEEGFGGAVADEMGAGEMDVEEQHEEEKLGLLKVVKAPRRTKGRKRVTKTVINAKGYMEIQDEWVTDDEDDGEDDPSPTSQEAAEQQKRDEEERAALNAETRKQTTKSKAQGNIMSYFGKKS